MTFEGVTRNNTKGRPTRYLDYECYEPMALKTMAEIGEAIVRTHEISRIAMVHRLGRVEIGETSVVVIAAAPHRRPAFEAALEGINKLKKLVPVWKKEYFADGEVWVDGEWDDSVVRAAFMRFWAIPLTLAMAAGQSTFRHDVKLVRLLVSVKNQKGDLLARLAVKSLRFTTAA